MCRHELVYRDPSCNNAAFVGKKRVLRRWLGLCWVRNVLDAARVGKGVRQKRLCQNTEMFAGNFLKEQITPSRYKAFEI